LVWFLRQKPVQPVWLGFFRQKPVQTGLARFFSDLGSVWFFRFQAYKTETELVDFFKILIDFFYGSIFSSFLGLIGFFTHPWLL
jgi:hypothetical protein